MILSFALSVCNMKSPKAPEQMELDPAESKSICSTVHFNGIIMVFYLNERLLFDLDVVKRKLKISLCFFGILYNMLSESYP